MALFLEVAQECLSYTIGSPLGTSFDAWTHPEGCVSVEEPDVSCVLDSEGKEECSMGQIGWREKVSHGELPIPREHQTSHSANLALNPDRPLQRRVIWLSIWPLSTIAEPGSDSSSSWVRKGEAPRINAALANVFSQTPSRQRPRRRATNQKVWSFANWYLYIAIAHCTYIANRFRPHRRLHSWTNIK